MVKLSVYLNRLVFVMKCETGSKEMKFVYKNKMRPIIYYSERTYSEVFGDMVTI